MTTLPSNTLLKDIFRDRQDLYVALYSTPSTEIQAPGYERQPLIWQAEHDHVGNVTFYSHSEWTADGLALMDQQVGGDVIFYTDIPNILVRQDESITFSVGEINTSEPPQL